MHLNQVTLPTVFIVDEGVALLPVEIAQHAAVLHPADIAHYLGLCHHNIVMVTMSLYISNMKTSSQQNVLVSYKSLEQILLMVPSSYRMQQQDEDNKFSNG